MTRPPLPEQAGAIYQSNPQRELPTRRGTELAMLGFAAFIVTCAFVLVQANQEQELSWSILWYGLAYLALFAIAHFAVRRWAPYADPLILPKCLAGRQPGVDQCAGQQRGEKHSQQPK